MNNNLYEPDNYPQLLLLLSYLQAHDYQFTTISPASHEKVNARAENSLATKLSDIFGWNRPFNPENMDADLFTLMQSAQIALKVANGWKSLLRVSSLNNQLFLHSAYPTLANSCVFFGPDTYRFAHSINHFLTSCDQPIQRAVDIGTGSGVGAAVLALALPESEIIGVDINEDALQLAHINIDAEDIQNIELVQSNLLANVKGNFDLIIANPPYLIDESERAYRHGGGQLGAALSLDIVESAIQRLNPNGSLLLYTGVAIVDGYDAFLAEVQQKLNMAGFTYQYTEIDPDIFGEELVNEPYRCADRIAAVVLTARKTA
ncbi:MAG: class I SAM-dependent methyltransferase [Pseudomonadota bacterium]